MPQLLSGNVPQYRHDDCPSARCAFLGRLETVDIFYHRDSVGAEHFVGYWKDEVGHRHIRILPVQRPELVEAVFADAFDVAKARGLLLDEPEKEETVQHPHACLAAQCVFLGREGESDIYYHLYENGDEELAAYWLAPNKGGYIKTTSNVIAKAPPHHKVLYDRMLERCRPPVQEEEAPPAAEELVKDAALQAAVRECDEFNKQYPVGSICRFRSGNHESLIVVGRTSGAARVGAWNRIPTVFVRVGGTAHSSGVTLPLPYVHFPPPQGTGEAWHDLKTDPPTDVEPTGLLEVVCDARRAMVLPARTVAGLSNGWWRRASESVQTPVEEATMQNIPADIASAARKQWLAVEKKFSDEFYDDMRVLGIESTNSTGVGAMDVIGSLLAVCSVGSGIYLGIKGSRAYELSPTEQQQMVYALPKLWEVTRKTIQSTRQSLASVNTGLTQFLETP